MKLKIGLIAAFLLAVTYGLTATAFFVREPQALYPGGDSVLLKTKWQQMGGFQSQTPDNLRLGCWSTAFAQIMYYHKLKPFGSIHYTSRNGYVIDETIDSTTINMGAIVPQIDSTTTSEQLRETSRYNYYAAAAIQKDFGTDRYMNKLAPASLLEKNYNVNVRRYISWKGILPYTSGKLEHIVSQEIVLGRPVFLHFADMSAFGHSVVIDGCKIVGKVFWVHLNQGQGGPQDGWYEFGKDILVKNDRKLRVIYTFERKGE